jgi:hypothetical protein
MLMLLRVCSLLLVVAYGVAYAQWEQPDTTTPLADPRESTTPSTVPPAKPVTAPTKPPKSVKEAKAITAPTKPPKSAEEDARARGAEWLSACLKDWDRDTHMTKQEWARTCQRVTQERVKFLIEQKEKVTPGPDRRRPANEAPR